jgi:hypothetical protein
MNTDQQSLFPASCELTTETGRVVHVTFWSWGRINVLVGKRLGFGRQFANLAEAAGHYKSPDVRRALQALLVIHLEALYQL